MSGTKFCVCDTSRHSRLFQLNCVFAHRVTKMPSRQMREDAKSFASAQLCINVTNQLILFVFFYSHLLTEKKPYVKKIGNAFIDLKMYSY